MEIILEPEITRGMQTALYLVNENFVSLSDLKKRGVSYNDLSTIRDLGWFEEKIESDRFFYRRKYKAQCSICGKYWFLGIFGRPSNCIDEIGHNWETK